MVDIQLLIFSVVLIAGIVWIIATRTRYAKVESPDLLAERFVNYFERDGMCFAAALDVVDGMCWFRLGYQNRYASVCRCKICYIPMEGMSKRDEHHDVHPIVALIDAGPGEMGVISYPYPIGEAWQGKIMIFDVAARVKHPWRRGPVTRRRRGASVGEPTSDNLDALKMGALLATGTLRLTRAASFEVSLPTGVATRAENLDFTYEILYEWNAESSRPD